MSTGELTAALERLRHGLAEVRLPLPLPGAESQKLAARTLTNQLDDYILPRLAHLDAPLLTVVGGSTGAGKSTLVNTLVGRVVSAASVIRPTTRSSVLIHHPDDGDWFESQHVLPGLGRTTEPSHYPWVLQLVPEASMPRGLALLDAPDIDSVVSENRALAEQLLGAADLWLFVTSAARYADAVPWRYLREAADRSVALGVVIDRVPPAAWGDVPAHLGQLMLSGGLGDSPLFAVPETFIDAEGLLPEAAVAPIRDWLEDVSSDQRSRSSIVLQTLDGTLAALTRAVPDIALAIEDQSAAVDQLRSDADASYAEAARSVSVQTADGTMLRGEVLTRWQDLVGTGQFFRAVEQRIGGFRDRLRGALRGEPKQVAEATVAVETGLEALIQAEADAAAERCESAWQSHPAGREVLVGHGELARSSDELASEAAQLVRDWQGGVLELVREAGKGKRTQARVLALGVNGVGVALMIAVFSQTGGLAGAEIGIAGGTAVVAQRLLEAVFGEDAVRRLSAQAKADLDARVEALMSAELLRFHKVLASVGVSVERAEGLRAAGRAVDGARLEATQAVGQLASGEQQATLVDGSERPALNGGPSAPAVPDIIDAEIVEDPS